MLLTVLSAIGTPLIPRFENAATCLFADVEDHAHLVDDAVAAPVADRRLDQFGVGAEKRSAGRGCCGRCRSGVDGRFVVGRTVLGQQEFEHITGHHSVAPDPAHRVPRTTRPGNSLLALASSALSCAATPASFAVSVISVSLLFVELLAQALPCQRHCRERG